MNSKSAVDNLLEKQARVEERQKKEIENIKLACRETFNDVNGKFFLQFLKRICGWNDQDNNINGEVLAYKKGRRDIWNIVRNVLPKDILAQVEIFDEYKIEE